MKYTNRFGEIQVKKSFAAPMLTSQYTICPIPFKFDPYKGCAYNCKYCFAKDIVEFARRRSDNKTFQYIYGNRPDQLRAWIQNAIESSYDYERGAEVAIKERIPVKVGATSDPFPTIERDAHITYDALKVFDMFDYPIEIQTKNPAILAEYADEFDNPNWTVAVSLISTDEKYLKATEPGAPTAKQRLDAIKKLTDMGIKVMGKIQPAIFPKILDDLPSLVSAFKDAGCWSFNIEGLRVSRAMTPQQKAQYDSISDYLGFDVVEYYKNEDLMGEYVLGYDKKMQYVRLSEQLAAKHGLRFFVADNGMGCMGCSGECCGTEVLRDYQIMGYNDRSLSFPTESNVSVEMQNVKANFSRNKSKQHMTIREVVDSLM